MRSIPVFFSHCCMLVALLWAAISSGNAGDGQLDRPVSVRLMRATLGEAINATWKPGDMRIAVPSGLARKPWFGETAIGTVTLRQVLDRWCAAAGVRWQVIDGVAVVESTNAQLIAKAEAAVRALSGLSATAQPAALRELAHMLHAGAAPAGIGLLQKLNDPVHGSLVSRLLIERSDGTNPWNFPVVGLDPDAAKTLIMPWANAELAAQKPGAACHLAALMGAQDLVKPIDDMLLASLKSAPVDWRRQPRGETSLTTMRVQMTRMGISADALVAALIDLLPTAPASQQHAVVSLLGELRARAAIPALKALAQQSSPGGNGLMTLSQTTNALGLIGGDEAADAVWSLYQPGKNHDAGLNMLAFALQNMQSTRSIEHLLALRQSLGATSSIRMIIDHGLRNAPTPEALALIQSRAPDVPTALSVPDGVATPMIETEALAQVRSILNRQPWSATTARIELTSVAATRYASVANALLAAFPAANAEVQAVIAGVLPETRDPRILALLRNASQADNAELAQAAFGALSRVYGLDPETFSGEQHTALLERCRHSNASVRADAWASRMNATHGDGGDGDALSVFKEAIADASPEVRYAVVNIMAFRVMNLSKDQRTEMKPLIDSLKTTAADDNRLLMRLQTLERRLSHSR